MGEDKDSSTESSRKRLKEVIENVKSVEDVVKAAYDIAEEDPRGTMELIDGEAVDSEDAADDDSRNTTDLLNAIRRGKKDDKSKED